MLQLITGRSGTGKSTYLYNLIKEKINSGKKIYVITPEQFSYTAEKKLLNVFDSGVVLNAEVLTFARMAYRIFNEQGGISNKQITKSGKDMLIYSILSDKKNNLKFLANSDSNIELCETGLTEFKKHGITVENLKNAGEKTNDKLLQAKLNDFITIYEKYNNSLENIIDSDDVLTYLANMLPDSKMFDDTVIIIDEFVGYTKQEYDVIKILLMQCAEMYISVCTDNLDIFTNQDQDIFYSNKQTANRLMNIAREVNISVLEHIHLDKKYRFKNEELIKIENNLFDSKIEKYIDEPKNIKLFLAKNPYTEIDKVAVEISKLVRNEKYRYSDIGIIVENISDKSNIFKVIFEKYNIPFFLDEEKKLDNNELIKFVLSILDIFSKNWTYESVFNYLKSGYTNLDKDELSEFENYCIKWNIRGSKWYKEDWNFKDNLDYNEVRKQVIEPLLKLKEKLSGRKTAKQISEEIYNFLIENEIDKKYTKQIEELYKKEKVEIAEEYKIAWDTLVSIFDEIIYVFGEEKITFEEYIKMLKVGMSGNTPTVIPQTLDSVIIGNVDRSRTHKLKAVFIISLNDGIWPKENRVEGFFNDNDREKLKIENGIELAKGTLEQLYENNFNIYKAFTTAEEKIFLSYTSSSLDGSTTRPSILIKKVKNIFPKLIEDSDVVTHKSEVTNKIATFDELINNLRLIRDGKIPEEKWLQIYDIYSKDEEYESKIEDVKRALEYKNIPEYLTVENIQKMYGIKMKSSVSKMETYKKCPFKYYLNYGLKLQEKETFDIPKFSTGSFMHDVVDKFFEKIHDEGINIKNISDEIINEIVDEIINEILGYSSNYIFTTTEKYKNLTRRLRRVTKISIKYIIFSLKNSDFEILGNEVKFGEGERFKPIELTLKNGNKVLIEGKIDRVDIAKTSDNKFIRIIDYKSSVKDLKLNHVYAGLQLQLLTYADTVSKTEEADTAGVLYFNLTEPILSSLAEAKDFEEAAKKVYKMHGLVLADKDVVKMMDWNIEDNGKSDIIPVSLKKDGEFDSYSKVISKDDFEKMQKYMEKILVDISEEITSGNISITPYYDRSLSAKTPCEYCNYKTICNFKAGQNGNDYNYISNMSNQEILEKMNDQ